MCVRVLTVAHAELSTVMAVMREIVPKLEGDSVSDCFRLSFKVLLQFWLIN